MTRQTMRMCTFSVVCLPARVCFCYSMAHLLQPFHMIKITSTHLEDEEDEEEDEKSGKDVVMYGIIVILSGVGQLLMDIVRMASVES